MTERNGRPWVEGRRRDGPFIEFFHHGQITVGELKEKLAAVPDDYDVCTEGCDCIGPSDDISVDDDTGTVTINRNDSLEYEIVKAESAEELKTALSKLRASLPKRGDKQR